jgi:hypothetical protein
MIVSVCAPQTHGSKSPEALYRGRSRFEEKVCLALERLNLSHSMDARSRDGFMHFDFLLHRVELECAALPLLKPCRMLKRLTFLFCDVFVGNVPGVAAIALAPVGNIRALGKFPRCARPCLSGLLILKKR